MERTLKISYLSEPGKFRAKVKPYIRISGDWLRNAGFEIGDFIKLKVSRYEIVIQNMLVREPGAEGDKNPP